MIDLLLIGFGKMGSALAKGWTKNCYNFNISIIEKDKNKINKNFNDKFTFYKNLHDFTIEKKKIDFVVLAVKPQQIHEIKNEINYFNFKKVIFISILAGKPTEWFRKNLSKGIKIVRAMPNLPASVLKGTTGVFCPQIISMNEKKDIKLILSSVGYVSFVEKEELIDIITSISGSGPAYYYYLTETLVEFGLKMGLKKESAKNFAYNTFIGSAKLFENQSMKNISQLRENVTSPGGTTEAALQVLMDSRKGLPVLIEKALLSAVRRAKKLKG